MVAQTDTIPRRDELWRDGVVSNCFSWAIGVTWSQLVTQPYGDIIHHSEKNPYWRRQIAMAQNATTPFIAEKSHLAYTEGWYQRRKYCAITQNWGYASRLGWMTSSPIVWDKPPAPPSTLGPTTNNQALMAAIQNARSRQTAFTGSTFIAELRDVIRGIRNPLRGIRNLLDAYHTRARRNVRRARNGRSIPRTPAEFRELERSNPQSARAAQRALADTWLEFQFGWLPLGRDVRNAYRAAVRLANRPPVRRFVGERTNDTLKSRTNNTVSWGVFNYSHSVEVTESYLVRYYGAVKCEVECPSFKLAEEFGFRTRDFLPAFWEAIPFSFLVDYFTNAGEVISALSFPRSDLAWISRTYRNTARKRIASTTVEYVGTPYPASNSEELLDSSPMSVEWSLSYVNRDKYAGSLVPSFQWEIPGSRNWRRWLNIAALARLRVL